MIRLDNYIYSF